MIDTRQTAQGPEYEQFEFRGSAREYFGIWIVNLLLSIVTLGIYSPWAKVRTKKYFYQNTYVAGRNFNYHARGLQILIGRAIVLAGFVIWSLLSAIPVMALIMAAAFLLVMPWLVVRAMMFNARMSSWSNVRFNFTGSASRALLVYVVFRFLSALTLFTTFPFVERATSKFSVGNHRLGVAKFEFSSPVAPFYRALFLALFWPATMLVLGFLLVVALMPDAAQQFSGLPAGLSHALAANAGEPNAEFMALIQASLIFGLLIVFYPMMLIFKWLVRNVVYNATSLDWKHRFQSDVHVGQLGWLVLSNVIVVICSMGLMLPWSRIRMARYMAEHTRLKPGGSLDDFVGEQQKKVSALGIAYTDLEGFDVGLPI